MEWILLIGSAIAVGWRLAAVKRKSRLSAWLDAEEDKLLDEHFPTRAQLRRDAAEQAAVKAEAERAAVYVNGLGWTED